MPDWQTELQILLSQLDVTLDAPSHDASGNSPRRTAAPAPDLKTPARQAPPRETPPAADRDGESDIPWELGALTAEEVPVDGDEVSAVRREVEATVGEVVALAHAGRMQPALRDDVLYVLQALTRPQPPTRAPKGRVALRRDDASQEWQLTSAAAVLRFCRIVLSLTHELAVNAEDDDEYDEEA